MGLWFSPSPNDARGPRASGGPGWQPWVMGNTNSSPSLVCVCVCACVSQPAYTFWSGKQILMKLCQQFTVMVYLCPVWYGIIPWPPSWFLGGLKMFSHYVHNQHCVRKWMLQERWHLYCHVPGKWGLQRKSPSNGPSIDACSINLASIITQRLTKYTNPHTTH